jgi:hypothetical protein
MQHVCPGEQAHVNRSAAHTLERSKDTEEGGDRAGAIHAHRPTCNGQEQHTHTVTLDTLRVCGE